MNEQTARLHSVECSYIGVYDTSKSTSNPKLCFVDAAELTSWVRQGNRRLRVCSGCRIDPPL